MSILWYREKRERERLEIYTEDYERKFSCFATRHSESLATGNVTLVVTDVHEPMP